MKAFTNLVYFISFIILAVAITSTVIVAKRTWLDSADDNTDDNTDEENDGESYDE